MMRLIVKAQVAEKESKDFTYEFDQPVVTLGRLKENDIQLPLSTVSGYHAQILQESDNYYLLDRGSINGTFLNGQRIPGGERKLLREGDAIRIQTFDIYFATGAIMQIEQGATVQVARQMVMEVLGSWEAQSKEKPRLIVMGGPQGGKQIELIEGRNVVMGRGANCDIVVDHPSVSRRHAEITYTWNGAFVKDLNSANGVYCNDQRITGSQKMHDRDEIQLGQQGAPDPIRVVFSNPAEALLARIEEEQITDGNPEVAEAKNITGDQEQGTKRESTVASPVVEGEAVLENPPAVIDHSRFVVHPKEPEPRHLPTGLIFVMIAIGVGLLGATIWYLLSRTATPVFGTISPQKAGVGEILTVTGKDLDGAGIVSASIDQRNAPILSIQNAEIKVKIPAFPQEVPNERNTELVLQDSKGAPRKFPFTLIIAPTVRSIDPVSGRPGMEVHIDYSGGGSPPSVFFGNQLAAVRSVAGTKIVCTVPDMPAITGAGIRVPVSVQVNQIASRTNPDFMILAEPTLQAVNPVSGQPGSEVQITTNVDVASPVVYFGSTQATLRSAGRKQIIVVIPSPPEVIPPDGLKLPVSVRSGDNELKNKIQFTIFPGAVKPPETFQLSFFAKPYSENLGFNEYSVETNIGPFLLLVAKDVYGSSQSRAEAAAKNLNDAVDFFKQHADAGITLEKDENNALYAVAADDRRLLLHVFPEDALGYGKMNQRVVSVDDLAAWWKMLVEGYYRVFVQVKSPADTGILSSGGGILQNVVNFFSVANQSGEKYYKKDLLQSMPDEQKSRLIALSFALPQRLASVEGKWSGGMTNILYSNISEPNLELVLTLHQRADGTIYGKADVNWKVSLGGGEGQFQNVAYKKLGSYEIRGSYDKTKSYPLEFTFNEKEQGRLNFVGRIEGNGLRGNFAIGATGESGTWSARSR